MSLAETAARVFVLILNYNGRELTIECVDSVLRSRYPHTTVVVIDNGSGDGSVAALKERFGDRIVVLENRANLGYSRGFNVGLKYAFEENGADYCLVMNNDTVLDPASIEAMVAAAGRDPMIGFVTGKVFFYDQPNILQTVGKMEDPVRWNGEHIGFGEVDRGQYDEVAERVFADDIFTLVRKRLYEEVGGYSSLFFLQGEEYDWQARAKAHGYKIVFTPHARLWHKVSMTLGRNSAKKAYYDSRNPMLVILLHKPPEFFRHYFWRHVMSIAVTSIRYAGYLRFNNALKSVLGVISGLLWAGVNRKLTLSHFIRL
jgi:GT2 family glycosyltransferase